MRSKLYSAILMLFITQLVFGQSDFTITKSYEGSSLSEFLRNVDSLSSFDVFYKKEWIDSTTVQESLQGMQVLEAFDKVLSNSTLNYYVDKDRIILLQNSLIVEQPPFLAAFQKVEKSEETSTKGLVFSREYADQTTDSDNLEKYVFEIGNRSDMKQNGEATLAGYVKDSETDEPIEGAFIFVQSPTIGAISDENGFYSLTLPTGKHLVYAQYQGMKTTFRNIILFSSGKLDIDLEIDVIALQEVTVEADRDQNIAEVQMGVSRISTEEVKTVPIVLGENDILKIATTKAGVQNVGEGASGFNVRGGKTDQNLVLFNGSPIYNTSHFFGFFSVFNSDAIKNMELYKSGIPAKYGGRLASVFEINSKAPNKQEWKGEGGISPITSKLTLEIPLIKDKTGLLVSGRSTYSNWVLQRSQNANFKENKVSFYDVIARIDHTIDEKNELTFSTYLSSDDFRLSSDTLFSFSNFGYQNINSSLRWDRRVSSTIDAFAQIGFTRYQYDITFDESIPNGFTQDFNLTEASALVGADYYPQETLKISGGLSSKRYQVNPGSKTPLTSESVVLPLEIPDEIGFESALYASAEQTVIESLTVYGGLRYVMFNAVGPQNIFEYASGSPKNGDSVIDSLSFGSGEIIKTYHAPEWRLSGRYTLNKSTSLKGGISRTRQYIHTLSNSSSLSPTDTWRLSGYHLRPQTADQVSLGIFKNLQRGMYEVSLEGYYKWMQDLVDFKTGADFLLNTNVERAILQGPGKSYGAEFSVTKSGRLNGWINYAYARTFIKLDGNSSEETVNGGQYFPTSYDKPHTVNLVANYKLTRRISFSLNTTYNTGRPVTIPVAAFNYMGAQNIHFSDRNSYRIPDYFRVDLGISLEGNHKIQKLSHSFWSLSIYNVTGRDNPYSVFFDIDNGQIKGSQLVVFSNPIPTLSYNFKF